MEGEDEEAVSERSFSKKAPWKRLIILVAGAFMNILLGFVLLVGLTGSSQEYARPVIKEVMENSGAMEARLMAGDEIVRANGRRVNIYEDLSWQISNNAQKDARLDLVVLRNGEKEEVTVFPKEAEGRLIYGMSFETEKTSLWSTVKLSYFRTAFYSRVVLDSFVNLISGKIPVSQISGPVGIVHEIGNAVETAQKTGAEGIRMLVNLAILLTINLGVFNLLPVPALDGGRILFVLIEMIRRKPVPVEKEAIVHFVGIVLLLGISVLIAFKDIFMIW